MNQAQQSAKWNPRDSMNFREQGASQKDKSYSETYSNKLSICYREQGRRWQAPSPGASEGWASIVDTQVWHNPGWHVAGDTAPWSCGRGLQSFVCLAQPRNTRAALGGSPGILSHSSSTLHPAHGSTDLVHFPRKDRTVQVRVHVNMLESRCLCGVRD